MDNRYAISNYPDAAAVTKQLDELIKLPIYTISPEALKRYEEDYFDKKCAKSKEMIEEAKTVIPAACNIILPSTTVSAGVHQGGGARISMMSTATNTMTFCRLAALRCSDLTQRLCAIRSLNCSTPAALPPACSTNLNTSLPKRYAIACPIVEMFRMLNSGSEACMAAVRVARLATKNKNIIKMGGAYHGWSDQLAYGIRVPAPSSHKRTAFRFTSLNTRRSFSRTISTIWSASSVSIRCAAARRRSSLSRSAQRAVHARWIRISTRA